MLHIRNRLNRLKELVINCALRLIQLTFCGLLLLVPHGSSFYKVLYQIGIRTFYEAITRDVKYFNYQVLNREV